MKNASHLVVVGIVLVLSLRASASVLFEDGFESDTATMNFADTSTTYYPQGWTTTAGDSREVMVYNVNAINDANKPATVPQGVNALRIVDFGNSPKIVANWGSGNQHVSFSCDIYMLKDTGVTGSSLGVRLLDASDTIGAQISIFQTGTNSGLDIKYWNGSSVVTIATGVSSNTWAAMEIDADSATNKFTVTYDGVTYDNAGSGYAFTSNIGDIEKLNFVASTIAYKKYYIDAVSVQSIPEPVTIGLLSLGSFLMFAHKKRK